MTGGRFATDWSRDGRFLLYRTHAPSTGWDIWALSLEGDQALIPIAQTEFDESNPQFSPDGHWVAYESDKTGRFEIYVRPFPGPGVDTPISTHGGAQVRWRPDGTELFYIALNGELTAVPIHSSDQQIRATGAPLTLFPTRLGDPVQQLSGALVHRLRGWAAFPDEQPATEHHHLPSHRCPELETLTVVRRRIGAPHAVADELTTHSR